MAPIHDGLPWASWVSYVATGCGLAFAVIAYGTIIHGLTIGLRPWAPTWILAIYGIVVVAALLAALRAGKKAIAAAVGSLCLALPILFAWFSDLAGVWPILVILFLISVGTGIALQRRRPRVKSAPFLRIAFEWILVGLLCYRAVASALPRLPLRGWGTVFLVVVVLLALEYLLRQKRGKNGPDEATREQ